jgi:hypothetical protein
MLLHGCTPLSNDVAAFFYVSEDIFPNLMDNVAHAPYALA